MATGTRKEGVKMYSKQAVSRVKEEQAMYVGRHRLQMVKADVIVDKGVIIDH